MKQQDSYFQLPLGLASLLGLGLYVILLLTGWDDRGLLIAGHWSTVCLYILTFLVLAGLIILVRPLRNISRYDKLFPASPVKAVGCWLGAAGLLYTGVTDLMKLRTGFGILLAVLALTAAVCLVVVSLYRLRGKQPHYLLHVGLTLYFMLHMVSQYRTWSAESQLIVYLFQLLGAICLMVTAYHSAALDNGRGSRRWFVFFNRAALFFCCVSMAGENFIFYLAMTLWTGTGLCSTRIYKKRPPQQVPEA